MDKKLKGDISEQSVILECLKNGFNVSKPLGDRLKYDLILDVDDVLLKIQVKSVYKSKSRNLCCAGNIRTLTNRVNFKTKSYYVKDFDFVVAHFIDTNDFWIISSDIFCNNKKEFTIEFKNIKNSKSTYNPEFFKNAWSIIRAAALNKQMQYNSSNSVKPESVVIPSQT